MNVLRCLKFGVLALALLLPAAAARPGGREVIPEGRRALRPLEARLEAMEWYSRSEPLNLRFTLHNPNDRSVWVLRWQLPSEDMDARLFQILREGETVAYRGPLVKRAAPEAGDYLEISVGETHAVIFDPSALYAIGLGGNYTVRYNVKQLAARTRAPEIRTTQPEPMLVLRDPERPPRALDTLPAHSLAVQGAPEATLTFEGNPLALVHQDPEAYVIGGYTKCTTSQQNSLQTATTNATTISGKGVNHLAANPNGSTLYTYWFGTYSSSRFNTVTSHFDALYNAFSTKTITYDCGCNKNYYAYVYPTKPYMIYLCRAFWSAPSMGRDSKAGTLVHEMSHFNVVASTDDWVYGASGAHNLALSDPNKAVDNADNHEYFAEDQ